MCRSKRSREKGNPVIPYPRWSEEKLSSSLLGKSWLPSGKGEAMTWVRDLLRVFQRIQETEPNIACGVERGVMRVDSA